MTDEQLASIIAAELGVRDWQVAAAVRLLGEGNTIPFIARYRKEATGALDEEALRAIEGRARYLQQLEERKDAVLRSIAEQGKLTDELAQRIGDARTLQEVEDLYLPYRPRRRTRAQVARERGLEPLAQAILAQDPTADPVKLAASYLSEEVASAEEALAGARDIIAEWVSDDAETRALVRATVQQEGVLVSRLAGPDADPSGVYEIYHDFRVPLKHVRPHQMLAINRGEREGALKVSIEVDDDWVLGQMEGRYVRTRSEAAAHVRRAVEDAYRRLIFPAIEREARARLTEAADEHSIQVFARNLRSLLMQPPVRGKTVMGIDPGVRTGCKLAIVDPTGRLLSCDTIYPHEPQHRWDEAKATLDRLIDEHGVDAVAIGNGTASRETEALVAEVIRERKGRGARDVGYVIVNEAGASVYSASPLAREELPDLDVSLRGAVSIARRLQDPLAELVKIEPRSIGVGQYQHDVDQKRLAEALDAVVESVVNHVGVDVNTASPALLRYVSGINERVARAIVAYRDEHGPFRSRQALKDVPGIGEKTFQQAAGFLRVLDGDNPLDATAIHPEAYGAAERLLAWMGASPGEPGLAERIAAFRSEHDDERVAEALGVGLPTLLDIYEALTRPGRDPRDDLPAPILRQDVLSIEDLREGMILKGTVRNVVDFGAFVDIGVKQDGLLHVSEMGESYVRDPHAVVRVGDVIDVKVIRIDRERGRIGLSMRL